jgi:hypothetical protein
VGCSGIQVTSQEKPGADLAGLRTFEWQRPEPGGQVNSIIDTQIERTVASELARIGVTPAPKGNHPDFIISYNTSVLNIVSQGSAAGVGVGMGLSHNVGVGFSAPIGVRTQTTEQGTLAISFIDPEKNVELWHATATTDIDRTNRDVQRIQDAIQRMILEFHRARGTA